MLSLYEKNKQEKFKKYVKKKRKNKSTILILIYYLIIFKNMTPQLETNNKEVLPSISEI